MVVALLTRHLKSYKTVVGLLRADRKTALLLSGFRCEVVLSYCTSKKLQVVPFILADIGEGIREVTVKEWHVNVGDQVVEFDNVCEVESDKATVTITSRYKGSIQKLHYNVGDLAKVGDPLVDIELESELGIATESKIEPEIVATNVETNVRTQPAVIQPYNFDKVLTTPAVRRIAAEKGIDLKTIKGSGKYGRVLKEDLLDETTKLVPITGYRKSMRNAMDISNTIPLLVITDEVDLTRLMEVKAQLAPHVKLTILPFLIKATSLALTLHPYMNCTPTADFNHLRMNTTHNIGVAIDTPLGLVVPNIKEVQSLSINEISEKLKELRIKANAGKLSPTDVNGGTFTLSNIGAITGSSFKPMIMPPEVALAALGQVKYRPRYNVKDELVKTPVMSVSWAADHRILDGATVARFFNDWKIYVENPALILANTQLSKN
ncbi:lipoamide acyltransferase component of branched-chain alpha-keto acid dehydrogenase complex, mitochondrial [Daktulosphaira vitifoliae]|uniref:lipoamide acyltransferase component of branched-chain alpha-keto acid dehydrogenase complex, mitochondrial n=1 Tax=Daktulosphaira vitifoliae TaxID=58002 RepID=UPI0021AA6000|nr:lipoamide acyltransferase component of branched-chain alpha-keto acid dehydrogenase complex, mitochondrial [Daktulosphaira vitifoliae]